MKTGIIGIDAATNSSNVGLAYGLWQDGLLRLDDIVLCGRSRSPSDAVVERLRTGHRPVLLAVDAPLGWPVPLAVALVEHVAGDEITTPADEMFRRASDRLVQATLGKTPLDVGADRIARTAHAALRFLGEIRRRSGEAIPLAWSPRGLPSVSVIEVYPSATLLARGYRSDGYKKPENVIERQEIIAELSREMALPPEKSLLERSADALDAAVCVLAAKDFLDGRAAPPPQDATHAKREGWIWVAKPDPLDRA